MPAFTGSFRTNPRSNAELLVLDDFSLGLDPGYRRLFIEYLKEYAKAESKTIFLTSHIIQDMERLIDDCIIMDYGKILIQKPVNELLNTFTRYRFTTGSGEVQLPANPHLYNTSVTAGMPRPILFRIWNMSNSGWHKTESHTLLCPLKK